jgi:hypothetical protein
MGRQGLGGELEAVEIREETMDNIEENQGEGKKASDRYLEEGSRTIRVEPSRRDIC